MRPNFWPRIPHKRRRSSRLRTLEHTRLCPVAVRAILWLAPNRARLQEDQTATRRSRPTINCDIAGAATISTESCAKWAASLSRKAIGAAAFRAHRWASLNFPQIRSPPRRASAPDDMRRSFNALFLGDKAMPCPFEPCAVLYFLDITPIGRDGDERSAAHDHATLVAIDLLAPAEQLLAHQVKERLEGVARAGLRNATAMIYLFKQKRLDNNPRRRSPHHQRHTARPASLRPQREAPLLEASRAGRSESILRRTDLIAATIR